MVEGSTHHWNVLEEWSSTAFFVAGAAFLVTAWLKATRYEVTYSEPGQTVLPFLLYSSVIVVTLVGVLGFYRPVAYRMPRLARASAVILVAAAVGFIVQIVLRWEVALFLDYRVALGVLFVLTVTASGLGLVLVTVASVWTGVPSRTVGLLLGAFGTAWIGGLALGILGFTGGPPNWFPVSLNGVCALIVLAIYRREAGDRRGKAQRLGMIGGLARSRGKYAQAGEYYQQSLDIYRDLNDHYSEAQRLNDLGLVAEEQGKFAQAREYYQQCPDIFRAMGDRDSEAQSLRNLGGVVLQQGEFAQAREYYQQSLDIACEVGNPEREAEATERLGTVALQTGALSDAREWFEESLATFGELDIQRREARARGLLGAVLLKTGDVEAGRANRTAARSTLQDLGEISDELHILIHHIEAERALNETERARELCADARERIEAADVDLGYQREHIEAVCEEVGADG